MLRCEWMNGKGLIVAVISVGVSLGLLTATLGGLILSGQTHISNDIRSMHEDISDLRERMARLEGLFEGHVKGDCE